MTRENSVILQVKKQLEKAAGAGQFIRSDKNGHIVFKKDRIGKYQIGATLGKGGFGRVIHVRDIQTDRHIALKIIRNDAKYRQTAQNEIINLTVIGCRDPNNISFCIKILDWFDFDGHICIAFDALGLSIFDFLERNDFRPFQLEDVRHIAYQLCHAAKFLHGNGITHTDVKPENMLFVDSSYVTTMDDKTNKEFRQIKCSDIRLIDFGSAKRDHNYNGQLINTRYYRAPELILLLAWNQACDIWSIGCSLIEMYNGNVLFPTHNDAKHLAMMETVLGAIPHTMANNNYWISNETAAEVRQHCKPINEYRLAESEDHIDFFNLIKKMLAFDPSERITAAEALNHPFLNKSVK